MAARTISIDKILNQIKELDYPEKMDLLEKVVSLIRKEKVQKGKVTLSSLNGLGAEIWKNVDIDEYLENERKWE